MAEYSVNGVGVQSTLSVTTGAAVSLTRPTGIRPTHAIISVEANSIRYTIDGTTPTAAVGILVAAGSNIEWVDPMADYAGPIQRFQAIGISGTATLNVQFRS